MKRELDIKLWKGNHTLTTSSFEVNPDMTTSAYNFFQFFLYSVTCAPRDPHSVRTSQSSLKLRGDKTDLTKDPISHTLQGAFNSFQAFVQVCQPSNVLYENFELKHDTTVGDGRNPGLTQTHRTMGPTCFPCSAKRMTSIVVHLTVADFRYL